MASAEAQSNKVKLESSDELRVEVEQDIATMSVTIKHMIEGLPSVLLTVDNTRHWQW